MTGKYMIVYKKAGSEKECCVKVPPEHEDMAHAAAFGTRLIRYKLFTCSEELEEFRNEPGVYAWLCNDKGLILARCYKTYTSFSWRYTRPLDVASQQLDELLHELAKGV